MRCLGSTSSSSFSRRSQGPLFLSERRPPARRRVCDQKVGESRGAPSAATREAKLVVLFTQSRLDAEGYATRDEGSSTYVATFEPAEGFALLVQAEAMRRGVSDARCIVVLGDGAPWIWVIADDYFPEATQVVDLYHARQHLHGLGALLAPALGETSSSWLAGRLDELDAGDIEALVAAVRGLSLPRKARCGGREGARLLRGQRCADGICRVQGARPLRRLGNGGKPGASRSSPRG